MVVVDEAQRRAVGGIYRDITLGYLQSGRSARSRYAGNPERSAIQPRATPSTRCCTSTADDRPQEARAWLIIQRMP